jgi:hypothetical protein
MSDLEEHDGQNDLIHQKLRKSIEKRQRACLWTPADAITFIPRLLPTFYGDGRALFTLGTINQRPAYWVIRGCSTWGCGMDREDSKGPDFVELVDDPILSALEEAFGRGRCGYSGNSLFWPKKERLRNCKCEECSDPWRARWPAVDDEGGCHWGRMDWPKGFETMKNPLSWRGNLLAIVREGKAAA